MSLTLLDNNTIEMFQGDSGELAFNNLPNDIEDYVAYFAIQNSERVPIGSEVSIPLLGQESVTIFLTGGLTDLMTVSEDAKKETYYCGLKLCSDSQKIENTVWTGTINVKYKRVEGI